MVEINLFDWKCVHSGMLRGIEGDEINRWYSHHCPNCGFYYDDSMGGTLREALDHWSMYMLDLRSESHSIAEQEHDRKFATREIEVRNEIEEFDNDALDGDDCCGYCGSWRCHGDCQLGGLG